MRKSERPCDFSLGGPPNLMSLNTMDSVRKFYKCM